MCNKTLLSFEDFAKSKVRDTGYCYKSLSFSEDFSISNSWESGQWPLLLNSLEFTLIIWGLLEGQSHQDNFFLKIKPWSFSKSTTITHMTTKITPLWYPEQTKRPLIPRLALEHGFATSQEQCCCTPFSYWLYLCTISKLLRNIWMVLIFVGLLFLLLDPRPLQIDNDNPYWQQFSSLRSGSRPRSNIETMLTPWLAFNMTLHHHNIVVVCHTGIDSVGLQWLRKTIYTLRFKVSKRGELWVTTCLFATSCIHLLPCSALGVVWFGSESVFLHWRSDVTLRTLLHCFSLGFWVTLRTPEANERPQSGRL